MEDWQLLKDYIEHDSQTAFRGLVERHLNLVYATCLREVENSALAEDTTQEVFLLLARKAATLPSDTVISGWLFLTARFLARNARRKEALWQQRTQQAMETTKDEHAAQIAAVEPAWAQLEPLLHEGLVSLGELERNAVLLRYLQNRTLKETGTILGLTEEAARKRVARALEKLRRYFVKRGIEISVTALATVLSAEAVKAAPLSSAYVAQAVLASAALLPLTSPPNLPSEVPGDTNLQTWAHHISSLGSGPINFVAVAATLPTLVVSSVFIAQVVHKETNAMNTRKLKANSQIAMALSAASLSGSPIAARGDEATREARERRIPQNQTPEVEVGLPAKLEDARGNATVTGRVLYADGRPAAGLKVSVYNRWLSQTELWGYHRNRDNHYRWPEKINRLLSGTATTGSDGTYRVTGLLPQRYGVHLVGFPYGNRAPDGRLPPVRTRGVNAVANQSQRAPDLILRPSALIRIRALDRTNGRPVEGVMWRGYIIDENRDNIYQARSVDARKKMRPMDGYPFTAVTDKNGICMLSLDEGKAYFYMDGFSMKQGGFRSLRQGDDHSFPFGSTATLRTQTGIYQFADWYEVTAPGRKTQRAWKGETEMQLEKNRVVTFTVTIPSYKNAQPHWALEKFSPSRIRP